MRLEFIIQYFIDVLHTALFKLAKEVKKLIFNFFFSKKEEKVKDAKKLLVYKRIKKSKKICSLIAVIPMVS